MTVRGGVAPLVVLATLLSAAPSAGAAGPSRHVADRYAKRTYIVQAGARRTFSLTGPRATVRASDGSTITAFGMVLADSGDGTGQAVLLFRGAHFLGWASTFDALHLSVGHQGNAITVRYGVYRGNDPFCCPSSFKTVRYRWNGRRIVASADPPLTYGRRGDRLHLRR
ncbi:MAG: LppP/LprE lipoprotein [Solirubrobacteraceae bacterium]|nr:LppP/LprE lipoprotein [Solirubrobacteraceae bacterium]